MAFLKQILIRASSEELSSLSGFVRVSDLVKKLNLEVMVGDENSLRRKIKTSNISRPGLELTGYFQYYSSERVQMFGRKEIIFMEQVDSKNKLKILRKIFHENTPAIVISRDLECSEEFVQIAKESKISLLRSPLKTSRLSGMIVSFLADRLAERISIHGVLLDVYGLGVLIQGDSGIGKSETGLELIKLGHRLIADDRVDVYQKDEFTVIGEAPEILKHLLEIRGVGIIDVMHLFGASAVRSSMQIQLTIYLDQWSKEKSYDRLGSEATVVPLVNVNVPQIQIPVKTGRNLSTIIEAAAMNFRARSMGFDATETFSQRLSNLILENSED